MTDDNTNKVPQPKRMSRVDKARVLEIVERALVRHPDLADLADKVRAWVAEEASLPYFFAPVWSRASPTFILNQSVLWFAGVRRGTQAHAEPIVGWIVTGDRVVGLVAELREDGSFKPAHEIDGFVGYYQHLDAVRSPDGQMIAVRHALPELAGRQDA